MKTQKLPTLAISMLFAVGLLEGCGTVTPTIPERQEASFDSTTPEGDDPQNSGILGVVKSDQRVVGYRVTSGFRTRWNFLLDKYRYQLEDDCGKLLERDAGIVGLDPQGGKAIYFLDIERFTYFLRLARWQREGRAEDSIWQKLKGAVKT